jgi:ATP-dependent DNA ligase
MTESRRAILQRKQAQLYAFDMLAGDGEDCRPQALELRKANLTDCSSAASMASSLPNTNQATLVRNSSALLADGPRRHCLKAS